MYFSVRECVAADFKNSYHIWSRYEYHVLGISFPFLLTCFEHMRYCKWRLSENKCSPSQQDDNQDSMHGQYLGVWCSLVTGNMWSYIANKPLYLFSPILKYHILYPNFIWALRCIQYFKLHPLHHLIWPNLLPRRNIQIFRV